ncbi:STAS domain-containing protein [Nonomuraea africana]|uniref:Anti-sigma factor antagonist n=1 Tax=Nonomuraea africana TaxID=46171 RepID=A0ABR9K6M4_9ACTN|nr:STAS domain-containing protein [Nonomuraea africana]MBE1557413.1 anti-sigma B factor antagonist [Nonomuraea africana]
MSLLDMPGTLKQPLRVGVRRGCAAVVLSLHGELDLYTKALLFGELDEVLSPSQAYPPGVVVDLSELSFCDSSGLGALIGIRKRMMAAGRPLALVGVQGMVARILHRTGLDRVFRCYLTVADAEHALADVHA